MQSFLDHFVGFVWVRSDVVTHWRRSTQKRYFVSQSGVRRIAIEQEAPFGDWIFQSTNRPFKKLESLEPGDYRCGCPSSFTTELISFEA
jgi:uncharacterized protein YPO0396